MSLSLLLDKYDVSSEEGLAKALHEIEKEELEVDEALSNVLSRACALEGRLRAASQAYTKLGEVKNDAQFASDMVDKTACLARDVSAKVRQLDLARSRVAECQRRVHDLIDLQLCSAGVEAAIKAHDYETGAGHVERFLSMDPGSLEAARARGAADPRAAMTRAADTLRDHLVRKFEEAARKDDSAAVERLFKLFPQIGRAEEGVDLLAKYLATQAEGAIARACLVGEASGEAPVFAEALTRVLETAAAALQRARIVTAAAPGHLPRAVAAIQPHVCAGAAKVFRSMVSARGLNSEDRKPTSATAAEPIIVELARSARSVALYTAFLRGRVQADASTLDENRKKASEDAIEKIIAECDLTRTSQDILEHYLKMERYFLEENVNKALKMATPQPGTTTSSLVDDLFFIARKAIRRSVTTGSVEGVCAVLNEAGACLERGAGGLRRLLRAPADPAPAALAPPPSDPAPAAPALAALAARLTRDVAAQRDLFLAHVNEAEAGGVWAERLAADACEWAAPLATAAGARRKLQSCAAGLAAAAAAYRAAHQAALAALAAALAPRIAAWAGYIADPATAAEGMEDDAGALPAALDGLLDELRARLSPASADGLLLDLLADLAARTHHRLLHHHYDREGAVCVERRVRRLVSWAGGSLAGGREKLAALAAAAAVLALERPAHINDLRTTHAHAAQILARRTDFKIEEIKRLKL